MQRYSDGERSMVVSDDWGSWNDFYGNGSQQLRHTDAHGTSSEECNCFRLQLDATVREDRVLTINVTQPSSATVRVAYLQAFGMRTNIANETIDAIHRATTLSDDPQNLVVIVNIGWWYVSSNLSCHLSRALRVVDARYC